MPPQNTNAKKKVPAKAVPANRKKIDEDGSFDGSVDEDEELDGEEGSYDLDEEEDDDENEEAAKPAKRAKPAKPAKPAKRAKLNGKGEAAAKPTKEKVNVHVTNNVTNNVSIDFQAFTEGAKAMFGAIFPAMSAMSVFVGELPDGTTDEDLKKLHPSIRTIRRPTSGEGLPATFGFLNFADKETADRALEEIKKKGVVEIRGRKFIVSENGNGKCHPLSTVDRHKLRIYGFPEFVTETIKISLLGCIDYLLGLLPQQASTLVECVRALFDLNFSHSVKLHKRKKQQKKQKDAAEVADESDDQDEEEDLPADKIIEVKKESDSSSDVTPARPACPPRSPETPRKGTPSKKTKTAA